MKPFWPVSSVTIGGHVASPSLPMRHDWQPDGRPFTRSEYACAPEKLALNVAMSAAEHAVVFAAAGGFQPPELSRSAFVGAAPGHWPPPPPSSPPPPPSPPVTLPSVLPPSSDVVVVVDEQ